MDTIFAVSSGAPPAAIAVIRVSGPDALEVGRRLAGLLPRPRTAGVRALRDDAGIVLDQALVLTFPGPRSATGEDLLELHLHGGRAVVRAVERALAAMPGLRAATPGEFTRRALQNGRIDLLEAEGLADLLAAETEYQRRAALQSASGSLSRLIDAWCTRTLGLAAQVEAEIDFSDEDDVPALALERIATEAATLAREMTLVLSAPSVDRLRDGFRIVIAGPPNSGKSTLINAMTERDAAIVSPVSGTTRDRIEVSVSRDGIPYVVIDTAGLAERTDDAIEAIGIGRARAAISEADVLLWLGDDAPLVEDALWIYPRVDIPGRSQMPAGPTLSLSATTGVGLPELWNVIAARVSDKMPHQDTVAMTERQRALGREAATWLTACAGQGDALLVAENLRLALRVFEALTGKAATEDMLDALFRRFCIGK